MKIIWHSTASIEYVSGGGRILFDPFIPLRGSKHRTDITEYDGFTDIFVTHGHFDHIVNLPEIAKRNPKVRIHCTETPYSTLVGMGIMKENLLLLNYGDSLNVNDIKITALHAKHAILPKASLSRLKSIFFSGNVRNIPYIVRENRRCKENDETLFYILQADGQTIFHMGSMNLRYEVEYPIGCDLLLLPYNGWEDNFPPAKATIERLKPKKVLLHHFDNTFPPVTSEPYLAPLLREYGDLIQIPEYNKAIELKR